ncbi:MAG: hypothetical protein EON90_00400 [Brevundimonas sp.]|nr:MAG: hypothetical protein EON90_00400 [Brevundimonas sp.]
MNIFPREWTEETEAFTVRRLAGSLVLEAKPGNEADFDAIARGILNRFDDYAAFPRRDEHGRYDSVQIISTAPFSAM